MVEYEYGVSAYLNILLSRPFQSDSDILGWVYFLKVGGEYYIYKTNICIISVLS